MTDTAWEMLSNRAVAAAGIVYFLALLAHLVEWSTMRKVPVAVPASAATRTATGEARGSVLVDVGPGTPAPSARTAAEERDVHRIALFGRLGVVLTGIAVVLHLVGLVGRGMAADPNRVPWGNMYEFTLSGTFLVAALYLVLYRRFALAWLSLSVVTFVLAILMVAVVWLYGPVAPLTEALNSYWLVIHVISACIATGAFTLGGMTSALYLVKDRQLAKGKQPGAWMARVPEPARLDLVAYRMHAFAFPVWTFAVLITGPIWAHQAWSSYWNWDPKEVWAFITWVVYAAYLHARSTAGWKGRNAAILALVGTATLWFNFIGINYFSTTSQHSYAGLPAPAVPAVPAPAPAVPGPAGV